MVEWLTNVESGTLLAVWAVPGSSATRIVGRHGDALKVKVAVPPEDGRANRALADALRRATGARRVRLVSGAGHRAKVFLIEGFQPEEVAAALRGAGVETGP